MKASLRNEARQGNPAYLAEYGRFVDREARLGGLDDPKEPKLETEKNVPPNVVVKCPGPRPPDKPFIPPPNDGRIKLIEMYDGEDADKLLSMSSPCLPIGIAGSS
jgi:hypothetical protein